MRKCECTLEAPVNSREVATASCKTKGECGKTISHRGQPYIFQNGDFLGQLKAKNSNIFGLLDIPDIFW